MRNFSLSLLVVTSFLFTSLAGAETKKVKIGFSMDTLKEEHWQRDHDLFIQHAKELGAEVLVQVANGNATLQNSQAENLLTQGADILVVAPNNGVTASFIVEAAHKAGKKVIAYDRLIRNANVDLYISYDNFEIGRLQGERISQLVPKGNYVLIGGAPTDNNAKLFREGQMAALQPLITKGDIKVVADQWAKDWQAVEALKHTENALTKNNNNIQAVVASNDGTAGGVISALKQQKLEGKVAVTGLDADLAACQRVAEGSQSFTIYKPTAPMTRLTVEVAIAMVKNESIPNAKFKVNNGKKDISSILLKPILIDKSNMLSTVVKDNYHKKEDIYRNIPKNMWPK